MTIFVIFHDSLPTMWGLNCFKLEILHKSFLNTCKISNQLFEKLLRDVRPFFTFNIVCYFEEFWWILNVFKTFWEWVLNRLRILRFFAFAKSDWIRHQNDALHMKLKKHFGNHTRSLDVKTWLKTLIPSNFDFGQKLYEISKIRKIHWFLVFYLIELYTW